MHRIRGHTQLAGGGISETCKAGLTILPGIPSPRSKTEPSATAYRTVPAIFIWYFILSNRQKSGAHSSANTLSASYATGQPAYTAIVKTVS